MASVKVYCLTIEEFDNETIEIGDAVFVGDNYIKVVSIAKVDFNDRLIWFVGILESDLNRTVKEITE